MGSLNISNDDAVADLGALQQEYQNTGDSELQVFLLSSHLIGIQIPHEKLHLAM